MATVRSEGQRRIATNFGMIANELSEIKEEFEDLLNKCKMILRGTGMIQRRAEVYWMGHIAGALEGRGSMVTMEETINELEAASTGEEDEDEMPLSSRADRSTRLAAQLDWIDIEQAADGFIRTGKDPEEVTVEDAAEALGYVNYDEAKDALPKILEKMKQKMGNPTDPRHEDPTPNQMIGNRKQANQRRHANIEDFADLDVGEKFRMPGAPTLWVKLSDDDFKLDPETNEGTHPRSFDIHHPDSIFGMQVVRERQAQRTSDMGTATPARRRNAKMDLMTGFTGKKMPDPDLGLDGNDYFEKWTTLSLPDTGKNSAIDDEQQPSSGGAPETVIPGAPLKTPMEAQDVVRPKLRESPEASRRKASILRKVASEIRLIDPPTARRLMAAADEISYDALSTASLPVAGDEANEVDDYHDQFGHGTLSFFGTDKAKSTSLTRESSRRTAAEGEERRTPCEIAYRIPGKPWKRKVCKTEAQLDKLLDMISEEGGESQYRTLESGGVDTNLQYANRETAQRQAGEDNFSRCEVSYKLPGKNWEREACTSRDEYNDLMTGLKEKGAETRVRHFDRDDVETNLQYANRGASRRVAAEGKTIKDIDWTNTLKLVDSALQGKYDRGAVAHILKADFDRSMALLKGAQNGESNMVPGQQGQHATASRGTRRARTQGDAPLKPEPTVGDQDGPGADGAGGFYRESEAPLQETMTAQDVERPKIRENPEATRLSSLWNAFRSELLRQASGTGKWNSGRYAMEARDYGDSVEIQASVVDRENIPMPVGSILFTRIADSPQGRYATVEVNDGILENRTREFTIQRPRQARMVVGRLVSGVIQASRNLIDGITV